LLETASGLEIAETGEVIGAIFARSPDGVIDWGRRAFDAKAMTPNKPTASNNMATTTFGLIYNEVNIFNAEKGWFDTS
jgi:hypothetical protein